MGRKTFISAQRIRSLSGQHVNWDSVDDDKTLRFNSRSFVQVSGDSIGFQSKPSQTVDTTGSVYGCQISPRVQDGIGAGNLIGVEASPIMKGTTAGPITGDMRGFDSILEDDSPGATSRTVEGDVMGIRFRSNLNAAVTGAVVPQKVLNAEKAGGNWDAYVKFEGVQSGIWDTAGTPSTQAGLIKVLIGATAKYIQLFTNP